MTLFCPMEYGQWGPGSLLGLTSQTSQATFGPFPVLTCQPDAQGPAENSDALEQTFSPMDIVEQIILVVGDCPLYARILTNVPGLPPVLTTQNISPNCQMSPHEVPYESWKMRRKLPGPLRDSTEQSSPC